MNLRISYDGPVRDAQLRLAHGIHSHESCPTDDAALKDKMVVEKPIEGTRDQVYRQIKKHYALVGGYGHRQIMSQAGFLENDETVQGVRTFAREVYPRLRDEFPNTAISDAGQMLVAT